MQISAADHQCRANEGRKGEGEQQRRIQIREAIKAHFDKEQALFQQGVKVLTLYFIDEVAKYRDYTSADEKGDYARIFEEEYKQYLKQVQVPRPSKTWLMIDEQPDSINDGYFINNPTLNYWQDLDECLSNFQNLF